MDPAIETSRVHVVRLEGCTPDGERSQDAGEAIQVRLVAEQDVDRLIREGSIAHASAIAAWDFWKHAGRRTSSCPGADAVLSTTAGLRLGGPGPPVALRGSRLRRPAVGVPRPVLLEDLLERGLEIDLLLVRDGDQDEQDVCKLEGEILFGLVGLLRLVAVPVVQLTCQL